MFPTLRALALLLLVPVTALAAAERAIPRLEKRGAVTQLIVDGHPFVILGGELHNSSGSNIDYLRPIWPKLAQLNLNTVLAPAYWQLIEPEEGKFNWKEVDGLVMHARQHQMRLVLLWFASWKNGVSHYAPEWVKRDTVRFPRAKLATGTTEVLSLFHEATLNADGRAFMALMTHLQMLDEKEHTVIMVQVQNEVGLLGDSRDRSDAANAAFAQPVPETLLAHLQENRETLLPEFRAHWENAGAKTAGTWSEVFGDGPHADEIFMGWNYARYLGRIVEAGKSVYALPMFVNAWIVQPADKNPGDYPSGGPQGHMLDVWRTAAPALDLFAPDIYLPNFADVCREFTRAGNTLFVPEARGGPEGVANAFVAIGQFNALGYSPFGIESREADPTTSTIRPAYRILRQLRPLIVAHQAAGTIGAAAVVRDSAPATITLGGYTLTIMPRRADRGESEAPARGYAMAFATGPDEFVVAGGDAFVAFTPATPGPAIAGLVTVEEGEFSDGQWRASRTLNGDEVMLDYDMARLAAEKKTGTGLRFMTPAPTIQRVRLYRYE